MNQKIKFAFFGTPDRAVIILETLKKSGFLPELIITQPDRPQGRKMILTPTPVKIWGQKENIKVLNPENLDDQDFQKQLKNGNFDIFIVVAYGKILKKEILNIPKKGCLNLHGSLLPKLRGSSPIETAILNDEKENGVTIILMDELMDHGPIVAKEKIETVKWPLPANELAEIILKQGGKLLAGILPKFVSGEIKTQEQNHAEATYAKKISKADGLIDLTGNAYNNFLKFNAYKEWPTTYFFIEKQGKNTRVTITDASFENEKFIIKKVIPEGRKEISFVDFERQIK